MPDGRRVLITGIAGQLAGLVARALEERDDVLEIIGVDIREPSHELERTEFVRADIRNPLVARIITASDVDTVLHMATTAKPSAAGGRARMKELNVIGAMQLLAACQKAPSLRRFVLKSTTAVYGAAYDDPALFREDAHLRHAPSHGFAKDAVEIEGYVRAFSRRRPDVDLTVLRFANFLGGRVQGAFDAMFSLPVVPTVMGFDPRLQFVHEEDGVEVFVRAVTGSHPGTFNVAGPGMLYLSQCARLAGRPTAPVPGPLVSAVAGAFRRGRRADVASDQLQFLRYGRGVDITRLVEEFGYTPKWSTSEAFEDYLGRRRITGLIDRDEVIRWERELYDFIQRKGQERFLATRERR
ncbi:MAG: NAD-dependent epimerase/dehydratase family protein [Nitriliruptor sp.]|uniref:NAD-dependent epimerase/dehydratase family protein n=1 Tax=Nitriliruptor sp. TaxID=2448056 RepID=UPI0034A09CF5